MKRWLLFVIGLASTSLVLAADPPKPDAPKPPVNEADLGEGVSLTIYNQNFVIVKERRLLELAKGRSAIRFRDVAATIVPETVQFTTLRQPDLARVVEQNYEFDLVSADKLLGKYIDREIGLVTRDGDQLKGKLLSFDEAQLMLKTDKGVDLVPRAGNVKDVQFSALPGGLLTRPTLLWQVDAKSGGKELVKVAYGARNMSWNVSYRARLNTQGDRLDMAGWVTVSNATGSTFKDARVKLLAGDVHLVQDGTQVTLDDIRDEKATRESGKAQFQEKSFGEYHLYELGRTTTIKESETKQIELMDVQDVRVARKYALYAGHKNATVLAEFNNDAKHAAGLGMPLPKGTVRLFQRDADGELELLGSDNIDHTPTKEVVKLRIGEAFDIVGQRSELAQRVNGRQQEHDMEIKVRNHKTEAVKVDIVEPINGLTNWEMLKQSQGYEKQDVNTLIFPVEVKPNAEVTVTYTIRYTY